MGRKLFVGCSHTMGYIDPSIFQSKGPVHAWQSNNYAEHFAKSSTAPVTIMASSGAGNREYVNFIAHAFKTYNDIDEVYVQSTYWGRSALAINPDLDEKKIFPLDFFIAKHEEFKDNIDRYSIRIVTQGKYLQAYTKAEPEDYVNTPYRLETSPNNQPSTRHSSYMYMQTYHFNLTHLAQQDYFRDMLLCDTLCNYNNAKMYVWNINPRCFIPNETLDFYTPLKQTTFANIDAQTFLINKLGIDINEHKADSEHYNEYAHGLIATHYIPYLKTL